VEEKNKVMLVIIMALLALLLAAIGFFGFSLMKFMKAGAQGEKAHAEGTLSIEEVKLVELTKALSTNIMSEADNSRHVASVNISIGVDGTSKKSEDLMETLREKESVVRDICLDVLRGSAYEELAVPEGKNQFRDAVLEKLRGEFQTNLIYQVYVKDWYLE
jgi:flagellar basal body-associated protein FliL